MANWVKDYLECNPERVSQIHSRGRGSITFKIGSNEYLTECSGNPIHYLDAGIWKPIDTALLPIGTEYGTPWSKTRLKTDGSVRIIDDLSASLHTQKTSQIGLFDPTSKKFTPVVTNISNGVVLGDSIIRTAGKFTHTLRLKETGLREELRIESAGDISGATKNYFVIETNFGTTQLWPDGWLDTEFGKAGNTFPLPYAIDANNKFIPLKRYAKYVGGVQYVYTGILISEISKYTFPLVIDPDYLDSTVDGYVYGYHDTSYSTARSTSTVLYTYTTIFLVGQYDQTSEGGPYTIFRSFLRFDTSAIGAGSTITQVNLKLTPSDLENGAGLTNFDIQIVKQDWSAQDPLSDTNREAAYDNCLAGTADDNIWRNTAGLWGYMNIQYTSGNLSTAWVNKTGNTYYSLRSNEDYNNSIPFADEFIYLYSQDCTTVAYRPILTVVHSGGAGLSIPVAMANYRQRRN
jgi:hypothetical protein